MNLRRSPFLLVMEDRVFQMPCFGSGSLGEGTQFQTYSYAQNFLYHIPLHLEWKWWLSRYLSHQPERGNIVF